MGDIFDIKDHPNFVMTDEDLSAEDLNWEIPQLPEKEGEGPPPVPESPSLVGPIKCAFCQYRKDKRTWWRRLLFRARSSDYLCLRFERSLVTHPVTEEKTYLRNSLPIPGSSLFTSERYRRCEDVNPDGKCREFQTSRK